MKTRKLSSDEVLQIIEKEFSRSDDYGDYWHKRDAEKLNNAKTIIKYIESMEIKSNFHKFIDRNQGTFWFFILITAVLFAAKVSIEAYLLNK